MQVYSDELYHHGVKGMKWGVRKAPEKIGRRIKKVGQKVGLLKTDEEMQRRREESKKAKKFIKKNATIANVKKAGQKVGLLKTDEEMQRRREGAQKAKKFIKRNVTAANVKKATKLYNKEYDRAETEGYKNSKRMQSSVGYKGLNDKSYFKEVDRIELSAAKVAAKAVKEKYGDIPISKISRGNEWTDKITGIKRLDKKEIKDYIKKQKMPDSPAKRNAAIIKKLEKSGKVEH